ncbi:MAG: hypothetical protein LH480_09165 [Rubrivivax sp.]|nr:hypothetical protein [Rubrivivax sp.]
MAAGGDVPTWPGGDPVLWELLPHQATGRRKRSGRNNAAAWAVSLPSEAPPAFRCQLLQAISRLRRYARALTFDSAEVDDLAQQAQQALERALQHWQQFDPGRERGVWLLSIAHNAHLDTVRREARMTATDPAELQRVQDHALPRTMCACALSGMRAK